MFKLYIRTGNAAFAEQPELEVARMLRAIADRLEGGEYFGHYRTLFDVNGNDVGRAKLTGPDDDD